MAAKVLCSNIAVVYRIAPARSSDSELEIGLGRGQMASMTCHAQRPSAWVERFAPLIRARGLVLDLACGTGRHTRYLLGLGHRAVAADIDVSGVADLASRADVEIVEADLESGSWPFGPGQFDAIVVCNYLHRPHLPKLPGALSPGGVLIFETFARGNEPHGRPRNPDFLLTENELIVAFAPELTIVAYEHGFEREPRPAVRQRICAIRAGGPSP